VGEVHFYWGCITFVKVYRNRLNFIIETLLEYWLKVEMELFIRGRDSNACEYPIPNVITEVECKLKNKLIQAFIVR